MPDDMNGTGTYCAMGSRAGLAGFSLLTTLLKFVPPSHASVLTEVTRTEATIPSFLRDGCAVAGCGMVLCEYITLFLPDYLLTE